MGWAWCPRTHHIPPLTSHLHPSPVHPVCLQVVQQGQQVQAALGPSHAFLPLGGAVTLWVAIIAAPPPPQWLGWTSMC